MQKRVVVTGLGLVTPLGIGVEETWSALVAGKSGISRVTRFDATGMATQIAGEVKEFKAEDYVSRKDLRSYHICSGGDSNGLRRCQPEH
jgi:3-oxoacyl-[acyl-carrier-protein] synthase II